MIQLLLRISEVKHVYDDLSCPNSFYGGLLESYYRGGETKIKVEIEENLSVMEDGIGKKTI